MLLNCHTYREMLGITYSIYFYYYTQKVKRYFSPQKITTLRYCANNIGTNTCNFMMMALTVKVVSINNFLVYFHLEFYIVLISVTEMSLEICTNSKEHPYSRNANGKSFTGLS